MAAPSDRSHVTQQVGCHDFGLFQDVLKRLRTIDDRVINGLNCSLPTESFKGEINSGEKCKCFYQELHDAHLQREKMIKACVSDTSDVINHLRTKKEENPENIEISQKLRKQQKILRQMQQELNVEEVVRDRSLKVFYERCRLVYLPPDFNP